MDKNERLNNTIKLIYDILQKNKEKESLKQVYEDIKTLKEKRNIN